MCVYIYIYIYIGAAEEGPAPVGEAPGSHPLRKLDNNKCVHVRITYVHICAYAYIYIYTHTPMHACMIYHVSIVCLLYIYIEREREIIMSRYIVLEAPDRAAVALHHAVRLPGVRVPAPDALVHGAGPS